MGRSSPRTAFAAALLATALTASPLLAQTAPAPAAAPAQPPAAAPAAPAAVPVDEAGAKALAAGMEAGLKRLLPHTTEGEGPRWTGVVAATPDGDAYKVTWPALSFVSDDGGRMDVGVITLRVRPRADGTQSFTAELPASIPLFDGTNAANGTITVGSQSTTGVWSPAYETLTGLDMALGTVAGVDGKGRTVLTIGGINGRLDLRPDGGGALYSGPGTFTLTNLVVQDETGAQLATIGTAGTDFTYTRVDLEKTRKVTQAAQANATGADPTPVPAADFRGLFGGLDFTMTLGDSAFFNPEEDFRFSFKNVSMSMGVNGLDTSSTAVRFAYGHDGLAMTPPPGPADFMPGSAGLSIAALKLPTDAFSQALNIASGKTDDTTAALVGGLLLGALGQAGSEIRLEKLAVVTPATSGHAAGSATFNAGAAFGADGAFTVTLTGLDNAIKALQPAAGRKAAKEDQETLAGLTMIQALGQPGKDAQGKDARLYKIDITPDGQLLLNGTDLSALMGLGDDEGDDGEDMEEEEEAPAPAKRKL